MRNILNDIKNNEYKRIYLLYGEEGYLKKQYKSKITEAICGDNTMNYSYFEGKNVDIKEVKGISDTLPFFADLRLVVLENTGFLKSSNEELAEYLLNVPETTTILIVEQEIDKRNKVFKTIKDKGYICEMQKQNTASLQKWIVGILNQNGKKITETTINIFLEKVGQDMDNISNEIEKLICYTGDREVITIEDINDVCTEQITSKVFDMIDALGYKNRTKALDIYYDLISNKESPLLILYMITRQFNIMIQLMELKSLGADNKKMSEKTGLAPFIVTKTLKQIQNFKNSVVKEALLEGVELEEKIKVGNINEKMAVEMLLIKYSEKS
ncbi:MAG: DNA polymerase III subunit delta [Lachnospiraceae bacterium]|nr:DNA polymerase III subunit delta [Lachnospiraceae bacterium]